MLSALTISEYTSRLASKEPAPGGGSAAALIGLLGASLLEMVINLTRGRKEFAGHEPVLAAKQAELVRLHNTLKLLIDRDAQAFAGVMQALQLPKGTEEEKQVRTAAVQKAMRQAAEVPLEIARACLEVLEIAKTMLGRINRHALGDLAVGAESCHAGAIGALLNTAINLPHINDEKVVNALKGEIHLIRTATEELYIFIRDKVYDGEAFNVMKE